MKWSVIYHRDVEDDLDSIGPSAARRIIRLIDSKLTTSPLQFGGPLAGNLANFRKLRIGDFRVVYKTMEKKVIVYVLAVYCFPLSKMFGDFSAREPIL